MKLLSPSLFPLLALLSVVQLHAAAAPKLFTEGVRVADALSPEEQRLKFHLPAGFKIQLVAAEPDLRKPMNMAFDSAGRLWITESREYPFAATNAALARDTIRIFSDFDDNGRARKITTFATNLNIPIGIYPFRSPAKSAIGNQKPVMTWKCLAWSIPHIWLFEDTDGDGVADKQEKFLGPFDFSRDTHGNQASFRRGLDGWIYATHGFNNQSRVAGSDGHEIFLPSGNVYRFRIDGSRVEHWTHGQVNPFGLAFDPLGNLYSADCHSSPIYQLLRGAHYPSFGRPHDGLGFAPTTIQHTHGSTAIGGIVHISDPTWPVEFQDNLFIGNVLTSRINRDQIEWRGSTSVGKEMPDFLSTDDPWFRPVDLQFGPDGALWVADFYNRIIGHYEVPLLHPGRDRERGRLWRIVPPGGANLKRLNLLSAVPGTPAAQAPASRDAMLNELLSENPTRRALAREELALLPNANDHGLITQAAQGGWHFRQADEREGLLTGCLWHLHRAGTLDDKTLLGALTDRDEPIRVHAARILAERGLQAAAQRDSQARPMSLPLPAGEGRGEGERSLRSAALDTKPTQVILQGTGGNLISAVVPPVLPHPNPLPLGEGTRPPAIGSAQPGLPPERPPVNRLRPASLPLPAGEGRGEGENVRSPIASNSQSTEASFRLFGVIPSRPAIPPVLPHPNPLPLGEGTRAAAPANSQPTSTSALSATLLAALRTALNDKSAHVQRAAADALAANPHPDNLPPLLALQKRVPAEDTHLTHVVRMALREQLRQPGAFAQLSGEKLPAADARAFAAIATSLTNAAAATFLVRHVESHTESAETLARYVTHAARYAPDADLPKLAALGRKQFATDLDTQASLFKAMHDGLTVRGGALPPDLRAWGTDLASQLLAPTAKVMAWNYVPLNPNQPGRNPFAFEERTSADGQKTRLMSSFPHGETLTGVLRSPVFVLPQQLSFYLCGHDGQPPQPAGKKNFIRLLEADTKTVLREAKVPRNDIAQKITWDLADVTGKRAVIEVTDGDDGKAYAWLAFGRFAPALPELTLGEVQSLARRQQAGADLARLLLLDYQPAIVGTVAKVFADSRDESTRAAAGRAWLALDPPNATDPLARVLAEATQAESVRAELAIQFAQLGINHVVVAALTNAPTRLQTKFAAALVSTAAGAEQLLAAAEAGRIAARLLQDRALTDRLRASPARDAKDRLAALVKNLPAADVQLHKLIEAKRAGFDAKQANAARGAEVFTKACVVCHQLEGKGALVGPQLDGIGGRGLERLLEDILDPNRNVDKAFRTTVYVLKDGENVSGLARREEGGAFIYALANGQEARVPKADVKERRETETSLMPANFIEALTAAELNDLLAFLLGKTGK